MSKIPKMAQRRLQNRIAGITLMLMTLPACAPTSHVVVGKVRPPIPVSDVRIYAGPPAEYEKVALVSASSKQSWAITAQGKTDKVIERLKEEAAKLGANGVILGGVADRSDGGVMTGGGTYSGGSSFGSAVYIPANHKSGEGLAIYVIRER